MLDFPSEEAHSFVDTTKMKTMKYRGKIKSLCCWLKIVLKGKVAERAVSATLFKGSV